MGDLGGGSAGYSSGRGNVGTKGGRGGGSSGGGSRGGFGSSLMGTGSSRGFRGSSIVSRGGNGTDVENNSFRDSVTADIRSGRKMMDKLEERIDRLESLHNGDSDDTIVVDGNHTLCSRQDVLALFESNLGVNCDISAGVFASPHFFLNEVMLTLGCSLPSLNEFMKLKRLDVNAIDFNACRP